MYACVYLEAKYKVGTSGTGDRNRTNSQEWPCVSLLLFEVYFGFFQGRHKKKDKCHKNRLEHFCSICEVLIF